MPNTDVKPPAVMVHEHPAPDTPVIDISASPEPSSHGDCGSDPAPSTARELEAKYGTLQRPFSGEILAKLYADAIMMPQWEQDFIPDGLRSILVFQNIVKQNSSRLLSPGGKVDGTDIAHWDIVPVRVNRPCAKCQRKDTPCEFERAPRAGKNGPGRKKCRTCRFDNVTCNLADTKPGILSMPTTPMARRTTCDTDADSSTSFRPSKRFRASTAISPTSASASTAVGARSATVEPSRSTTGAGPSLAHLNKETLVQFSANTLVGIVTDLQGYLDQGQAQLVELKSQHADQLAEKDREIAVLKRDMSKMQKDTSTMMVAINAFKAKYQV